MAWYDGLFDAAKGVFTSAISGIDWETVAKDALGGAVIAEISGGDVWKSAMYSGFGSMVGSSDYGKELFNDFAPEVGGAISGYGVAQASGESGLLGALAGAGYKSRSSGQMSKGQTDTSSFTDSKTGGVMGSGSPDSKLPSTGLDSIDPNMGPSAVGGNWLEKYGLIDTDGKPTTMGESAAAAVMMYHKMDEAKKAQKESYKKSQFESDQMIAEEQSRADIEFRSKQRQISGLARYGRK
tara:strand:- start:883 stop:1599 length:717 start_codon:yes stop_codon:yes gene_type:complete